MLSLFTRKISANICPFYLLLFFIDKIICYENKNYGAKEGYKKNVNIYTNHPAEQEVLDTYYGLQGKNTFSSPQDETKITVKLRNFDSGRENEEPRVSEDFKIFRNKKESVKHEKTKNLVKSAEGLQATNIIDKGGNNKTLLKTRQPKRMAFIEKIDKKISDQHIHNQQTGKPSLHPRRSAKSEDTASPEYVYDYSNKVLKPEIDDELKIRDDFMYTFENPNIRSTKKYVKRFPEYHNTSRIIYAVPTITPNKSINKPGTKRFIDIQNLGTNSNGHYFDGSTFMLLKNKTVNYAKKFFNFVKVVKFPNKECMVTITGSEYEGICVLKSECDDTRGQAVGTCAEGHGVCCVYRFSCGERSDRNCTYFESPGYPNYYPNNTMILPPGTNNNSNTIDPRLRLKMGKNMLSARNIAISQAFSCIFDVYKQSNDVKVLRIDFLDLEFNGPVDGSCTDERFVVMGQNTNNVIPPICGLNTGQHIYVDVSDRTQNTPIQVAVLSNTMQRKRFRIRVCQFEENCVILQNCLQYYTGTQGVISSFNYDQTAAYNRSYPGYFNNLNYVICVRRESGYCSITYTNVQNGVEYPFDLPNVNEQTGMDTVPPAEAGIEMFNCPDDYIVLNGLRLCGFKLNDGTVNTELMLNAPVTDDSNGPFILPVRTNSMLTGRGFKLFYTQNSCN